MVGTGLPVKIGLEPKQAKRKEPSKLEADLELLKERIQLFGRSWAVTAAASGSTDPGCLLQAAKALAGLVALFGERKAAAYKSQTKHTAAKEAPWRGLLPALLAGSSAAAASRGLALPALAGLVGYMPEVVPIECCPLLVWQLDALVAPRSDAAAAAASAPAAAAAAATAAERLTAGAQVVMCLLALVPLWRAGGVRPYWQAGAGTARLGSHLRLCVAACAAHFPSPYPSQNDGSSTPGSNSHSSNARRGGSSSGTTGRGVAGPGRGPAGVAPLQSSLVFTGVTGPAALAALAAALRLASTLLQLQAGGLRRELLSREVAGSWVGLLLDAHDVATAAVAAAQAALQAAATVRGSSCNSSSSSTAGVLSEAWRVQALSLEMLRQLSSSRRFWAAVLLPPPLPEHAPGLAAAAPSATGAAAADAPGSAVAGAMAGRGAAVGTCLAARLLLGLSYHLGSCAPCSATGAGSSGPRISPGSNAALLTALVPLLAQPELWGRHRLSRLGIGGERGHAPAQQEQPAQQSAAPAAGGDFSRLQQLQLAREVAMQRLLAAVVQCAGANHWKLQPPSPSLRTADGATSGGASNDACSGSSSEPTLAQLELQRHFAGMRLLPVLAAALMPDAVPYGHKPHAAWAPLEAASGSVWEQALRAALVLASRAALQHTQDLDLFAPRMSPPVPGDGVAFADSMASSASWSACGSSCPGALPQPVPAALSRPEEQLAWAVAWQLLRQLAPLLPDVAAVAEVSEAVGAATAAAAAEADAHLSPAGSVPASPAAFLLLMQARASADSAYLQLRHFWAMGSSGSSSGALERPIGPEGGVAASGIAIKAVDVIETNVQSRVHTRPLPLLLKCTQVLAMAAHVGYSARHGGAGDGGGCGRPRADASAARADTATAAADGHEVDRLLAEWAHTPHEWRRWSSQQQRLYTLARCCLALAAAAAAVAPPTARLPPPLQPQQPQLEAAAYAGLHAALSGLLRTAAATPPEDLAAVLEQEPLGLQLQGALQHLARSGAGAVGTGSRRASRECTGGSSSGWAERDASSDSSSDSDDDGAGADATLASAAAPAAAAAVAGAAGAAARCWYAAVRLHEAAGGMVRGEVACLAAALLATCYGQLGAATAPMTGGCSTSPDPLAVTATPAAGFSASAIEEYADASFVARGAGGGGGINGSEAQPQLRSVAALVAAGCPVLRERLMGELQAAAAEAAPADTLLAGTAADAVGVGGEFGGGGGDGKDTVLGWRRHIQVALGQRVPWRALQAVLAYLSCGHVDMRRAAAGLEAGLAAGLAAPEAETQQHQAAAAVAKEVAALAVGLGLPELRALARGGMPRPGNTPPAPMPHLRPLQPTALLVLQPEPARAAAAPRSSSGGVQGEASGAAHSDGPGVPQAAPDAAAGEPSQRLAAGAEWNTHPHLEDQLSAVVRWEEQVMDAALRDSRALSRGYLAQASAADGDVAQAHPDPRLHLHLHVPPRPLLDMRLLLDTTEGSSGGWPADAVIAAPLLVTSRCGSSSKCVAAAAPAAGVGSVTAPPEPAPAAAAGAASAANSAAAAVHYRTALIPAHRVVLAASCEYFAALCSDRWQLQEPEAYGGGGGGAGAEAGQLCLRPCSCGPSYGRGLRGRGEAPPAPMPPAEPPARALALTTKLLRAPACDAEVLFAILHNLHPLAGAADRAPQGDAADAGPDGIGSGGGVRRGGCLAGMAAPLLQPCQWRPMSGAFADECSCRSPGGDARADAAAEAAAHAASAAAAAATAVCASCRELRLCIRMLQACNALLLPHLEGRVTDHILRLLWRCRRQRCTEAPADTAHEGPGGKDGHSSGGAHASDHEPGLPRSRRQHLQRLAPRCLLTAVRDGLVLQLPWLVAAASEALTTCFSSAEARQEADGEWQALPDATQRALLDAWARRARGAAVGSSSGGTGAAGGPAHTAAPRAVGLRGGTGTGLDKEFEDAPDWTKGLRDAARLVMVSLGEGPERPVSQAWTPRGLEDKL